MCFVCLLLDIFLLFPSNIVLLLSWYKQACNMSIPCSCIKYRLHSMVDMLSSRPISSVLQALFELVFCLVDELITAPWPSIMAPPDCPLQSQCTLCTAAMYHFASFSELTVILIFKDMVPFKYCSTQRNFPQSSLLALLLSKLRMILLFVYHKGLSFVGIPAVPQNDGIEWLAAPAGIWPLILYGL